MYKRVNRDRITPIVLALLAVLALGASAATLNTARHGLDQGSSGDVGTGGDGSTFNLGSPPPNDSSADSSASTGILQVLFGVLLLIGCIGLAVAIYRNGRSLLPVIAVMVLFAVLVLLLFYGLQRFSTPPPQKTGGSKPPSRPSGAPGNAGDVVSPIVNEPSTILFVFLAGAVIVAAILLVRSTGNSPLSSTLLNSDDTESDTGETSEAAAVGAAAGRAADKIESETETETDVPFSNAIYHAWQEMTSHLDLQRETTTPGEFAVAAVAAGMAHDDVDELTTLFEATRYGNVDASEEREQRAVAALRRIEREYTEQ